jgi:hypothetical protein
MTAALVAGAILFSVAPAIAQQPAAPFVYDAQVTTSPTQIIIQSNTRKAIEFCNPNASISVAICPAASRRTGNPLTCAYNGRGSITLPPSTCWAKYAVAGGTLPSAWNGVAASGTANITIFELE